VIPETGAPKIQVLPAGSVSPAMVIRVIPMNEVKDLNRLLCIIIYKLSAKRYCNQHRKMPRREKRIV